LSTNELAALERVRPQSMSITVKALEDDGLVSRRPHPTDGRTALLQLTRKGVKTLETIFAVREDWLNGVITEQLTERERGELKRGLALIKKIVDTRNTF
jgi:DNA-binding MarR family transcriptional regulator